MTVEDLLISEGITYRGSGKDYLIRCLNPEHEDKNPSLRIDKVTGIYNCLSCGFSGNLFYYFGEKPNWLDIKRSKLKTSIKEKIRTSIGIEVPKNAVLFNKDWRNISAKTYNKFGAFEHSDPEFIGRIVFPVKTASNRIVGFIGRDTTNTNKLRYLITPADISLPLFPIVRPIKGSIILVEGIFDMLNLHDKGLDNAVCAFGVNKLNIEKLNILKIQGVSNIDIFFDNDSAGQEASENTKKFLVKNDISSRNVVFKGINDPGELTASKVIQLREKLYGS